MPYLDICTICYILVCLLAAFAFIRASCIMSRFEQIIYNRSSRWNVDLDQKLFEMRQKYECEQLASWVNNSDLPESPKVNHADFMKQMQEPLPNPFPRYPHIEFPKTKHFKDPEHSDDTDDCHGYGAD